MSSRQGLAIHAEMAPPHTTVCGWFRVKCVVIALGEAGTPPTELPAPIRPEHPPHFDKSMSPIPKCVRICGGMIFGGTLNPKP